MWCHLVVVVAQPDDTRLIKQCTQRQVQGLTVRYRVGLAVAPSLQVPLALVLPNRLVPLG